ncbi:hypothetical protein TREES_T100021468 [Tupaia chinensis]|uniref:Uncharacterized protein n=1 Tax=Tupaia chinensis TaxID=246437 RepID=L9KI21_TUPCH|nr:hypothetical protein TREES_T100021468 [Tupaia chinensis]
MDVDESPRAPAPAPEEAARSREGPRLRGHVRGAVLWGSSGHLSCHVPGTPDFFAALGSFPGLLYQRPSSRSALASAPPVCPQAAIPGSGRMSTLRHQHPTQEGVAGLPVGLLVRLHAPLQGHRRASPGRIVAFSPVAGGVLCESLSPNTRDEPCMPTAHLARAEAGSYGGEEGTPGRWAVSAGSRKACPLCVADLGATAERLTFTQRSWECVESGFGGVLRVCTALCANASSQHVPHELSPGDL